jgi:signal transduction histidine kinase
MMISRKIIGFFCFLFYSNIALCQHEKTKLTPDEVVSYAIPSPSENLRQLKQSDTVAISKQINYSLTIIRQEPDSTRYLLRDALNKSLHLNYACGIATALADLGYVHTIEGDHKAAIAYYQKAVPYAIKGLRNRTSLAMFYTCMGAPYFHLGMYDSMYYYSSKAEQIVSGIKSRTEGEVVDVSSIYNNIALLWGSIGNAKKSKYYFSKAKYAITSFGKQSKGLQLAVGNINSNIGLAYIEEGALDSAKYFLDLSLKDFPDNPITLIALAGILIKQSKQTAAIELLQRAIVMSEQAHSLINNMNAKAVLGIIYYDQKRYREAEVLLTEVIRFSDKGGNEDLTNAYHAYKTLADIKAAKGNYKEAYILEQKSLELLDSIKVKEKKNAVYDIESQLVTARKDKAIARNQLLLSTSNSTLKERNYLIIAIGLAATIFIVLLALFYKNSKNKQRLQLKELNDIQKDQEIKYLRATIKGEEKERARLARDIHDGIMVQFSSIKTGMKIIPDVYKKINSEAFFETDYYTQLIGSMESATAELRNTAHNLMPDMLLQDGLAEAVFYFCSTIKKRTALAIDFQLHGNIEGLSKDFELSVYRIVQELLQNIIKHANASRVMVQMTSLGNEVLTITIEDDGCGFDVDKKGDGMGLLSIRNRLRIMNGNMDIQSVKPGGTSVHIEFEILSSQ